MTKRLIMGWLGLIILLTTVQSVQAENISQYHAAFDFELSDSARSKRGENVGRGEAIEDLVPQYGKSYEDEDVLREAVTAARQWYWGDAYSSLEEVVANQPDYLDAYRLNGELLLINQEYYHAQAQFDEILRRAPTDLQALTLSIVSDLVLNNRENMEKRLAALYIVDSGFAEKVESLISEVQEQVYVRHDNIVNLNDEPEVIVVFGERPNEDGTLTDGLLDKLTTTLELAEIYLETKILVSGGDVHTEFTEASLMKDWLVNEGVNEDRIIKDELARDTVGNVWAMADFIEEEEAQNVLLVTKANHVARAYTLLTLRLSQTDFDGNIDAVTSNEPEIVSLDEINYTYINAFRTINLFEKNDF